MVLLYGLLTHNTYESYNDKDLLSANINLCKCGFVANMKTFIHVNLI